MAPVCASTILEYNHPDIAQNHFNETNYLTEINNIMARFDEHFQSPQSLQVGFLSLM